MREKARQWYPSTLCKHLCSARFASVLMSRVPPVQSVYPLAIITSTHYHSLRVFIMRFLSLYHVDTGILRAVMLITRMLGSANSFCRNTPRETRLEIRQQPAVIASSSFLRRAYHASTVVGHWVYIDGGQFSFMNNGTPNYMYSATILSIDLSQNWTNSTVAMQSTAKPDGVPNLSGPSLWYDESRGLLYSGYVGSSSSFDVDTDPQPPPLSLWTFKPDNTGSGEWNELFSSDATVWKNINRLNSPCMAWDSTTVHMIGGYLNGNGTASAGEVRFYMPNQTFSNSTIENGINSNTGRANGATHFVPAFGPEGMFLTMGGEDNGNLLGLDSVLIFDPSTQAWFNQNTTGNAPSPRKVFCIAGISSTNNTYEM